jgi:hypothetical protein
VQAIVSKASPAAGLFRAGVTRRVSGDARNFVPGEPGVDLRREPGGMARLADNGVAAVLPRVFQECAELARIEGQAWRQLQQERAKAGPERADIVEKGVQGLFHASEARLVGDRCGKLHGEAECRGDRRAPALEGLAAVDFLEGRIDLDAREDGGVALQAAAILREMAAQVARDRPASRADPHGWSFGHQ